MKIQKMIISIFIPNSSRLANSFPCRSLSKFLAIWLPQRYDSYFTRNLLGNTFVRGANLNRGTKVAESKLLEFSVVLLGTTVSNDCPNWLTRCRIYSHSNVADYFCLFDR